MEAILRKAAAEMPEPVTEFEEIAAKYRKKAEHKASSRRLRPVLIVLALAILLAGCAAAYGTYKASRGTWRLWGSGFLVDAKIEMAKYGVKLPEEFEDCPFREMSVDSSVPRGISWVEAIFSGYKSVHASYGEEELCYTVAAGNIRDDYWMTYFGYDAPERSYMAVEYKGYTIHTGRSQDEEKNNRAIWVDPEREICVSVRGFDGRDPLPLAKWIIDHME